MSTATYIERHKKPKPKPFANPNIIREYTTWFSFTVPLWLKTAISVFTVLVLVAYFDSPMVNKTKPFFYYDTLAFCETFSNHLHRHRHHCLRHLRRRQQKQESVFVCKT
jgi:hypothetical protein